MTGTFVRWFMMLLPLFVERFVLYPFRTYQHRFQNAYPRSLRVCGH